MNSEQQRALERTVQSDVDGVASNREWGSVDFPQPRPSMNAMAADQRSVRFGPNVTMSNNDRDIGYRDFQDTPFPETRPNVNRHETVGYGRHSDVSARSNTRSIMSGFSDQVRHLGVSSTRMSLDSHPQRYVEPSVGISGHNNTFPGNRNETYTIRRENIDQSRRAPEGQWIFVPYEADDTPNNIPRRGMPGRYVFLPFDMTDTWPAILGALTNRTITEYADEIESVRSNTSRNMAQGMPYQTEGIF